MEVQSAQARQRRARRSAIGLAAAADAATAAGEAFAALPAPDRTWPARPEVAIVIPREWRDPDAQATLARIGELVGGASPTTRLRLFRTPGVAGQAAAALRERWFEQELGPGAERFDRVRAPAALRDATRVFLAPAGGAPLPSSRPAVIAAAFAHPRQRAVARLESDAATVAELAMPLLPRLSIAVARLRHRWLAAAAADPVAAELAWLALSGLAALRADVVPWQDPIVQRLCLLGPFAQRPADLILAPHHAVDADTLRAFAEELGVSADEAVNRGGKQACPER